MTHSERSRRISVVEETESGEPIYGMADDIESQLHTDENYRGVEGDMPIENIMEPEG